MNTNYVVISPVRDEEQFIDSTIRSVIGQTVLPAEWIIVDDGSLDGTAEIVAGYLTGHPWIRLIRRRNRGFRHSGAGVMEAFYEGYEALQFRNWDFLVKLDGDLTFDHDYFAKLLARFSRNPKLGIAGGDIFHKVNGALQLEKCPRFHVRGATKMYRRECWEAIGGLLKQPGWDNVDETTANMRGWTTESFAEIPALHARFTGTAEGRWKDQIKNGRADYVSGYHPLFMAAKCLYRVASPPYVFGAIGMAYGFLSGYLKQSPRIGDRELIQYVRRQQMRRLWGRETIWK